MVKKTPGASKPDETTGNKVEPTTKAKAPPPGKAQSHEGHPHGGKNQPWDKA
jgi:hypothetical protein